MTTAQISRRMFGGLGAAGITALLLASCGSNDSSGSGSSEGSGSGQAAAAGGKLTLAYNSDGPHKAWVEAVCNSVSNTLGISMEPLPFAQFSEMRKQITDHTLLGAFRTGWQGDYPSMANFLGATFRTGAGANDSRYSNEEFDKFLDEAAAASTDDAALELHLKAQAVLMKDLPAIPLWYQNGFGGHSNNVSDVVFNWKSVPEYSAVKTTAADGIIFANGTEPQNALIPSNTNEVGGGRVVDLVFANLVRFEVDGTPVNEVAESIETEDNQTYTIKIKDGWTFTDGTPVTADSFIKAWNYGALLSNAHLSSYFYEVIEGFSFEEDSELTGLTKIDDLTFTVKLTAPASDFKLRLGYTAFAPLPEVAFEDMEAFGQAPIGNGPYKVDSWTHDSEIVLSKNADYKGGVTVANEGVTFTMYTDYDAAYNDLLADSLDVIDALPDSALSTFAEELGERAINQPGAVVQLFAIDCEAEHFKMDEEGRLRRAALSRAVNRKEICDTLFYGTRTPASDFTSPVIAGWTEDVEGNEVLDFDEAEAKSLWEQANAIAEF
ncbi:MULTISPECIES: ABC transporter substrate-binding protein [unclassified Actinomyces]|uniref:ABC transporter substrate-binding protein n=1 Tax=unclassified Actinomyces TaxID=2609248 RepID=UPI002017D323|nr:MULTISPECIES: ABC transporter substrate-binding protein [unclassified Actinomyces]MCL3776891.1 peptide ABC transporter substrate-binding protein [Actinomyces sp. AC-20-1]MCL3790535.1 peptide ABC transporter substrate-binding protein [Actinomyces sp. 187325]MCL3792257.1 peptide ABC transporter substrate-binding protein [Actinomyces sp. 186855]MCL3794199.1 peptide ABC transporter substrate-binding protein [Actinomyces sp. 217892]